MSKEPKIRSIGTICTSGVANVVYTCPDNHVAKMVLMFVSNHGGNNKLVTIQWYDASTNQTYYIVGGATLGATEYIKLDGSYLVLNPGDTFIVTPEATSSMDVTVTVEEYYDPLNNG
jgi:hypothetical protein